ncbi:MAG: hypothetical protein HYR86_07640 [Candidatus Rokubacteria bacterium]|nr:hypothetical protein [Candidatus Rokubacteria bacterium]
MPENADRRDELRALMRPPRWLVAAATALPAVVLVTMVVAHHVDLPYWDEWDLVPLIAKQREGTLALRDLWQQHNEHRHVVPLAIELTLARLSGWNLGWEVATSLVLGGVILAVLAVELRRTLASAGQSVLRGWTLPAIALLTLSLAQSENWMWGWQMSMLLNVAAATGGFALLSRAGGASLAGALALGVVAVYSFANGGLYWPLGLLVLAGAVPGAPARRPATLVVWAAAGALTIGSYLYGLRVEGSPALALARPGAYVTYVLGFLGNAVAPPSLAPLAGAAGVLLLGLTTARLLAARARPLLAFWLAIALYAVASAAVAGLGRLAQGQAQALAPRYVTFATPLWIADAVLLSLCAGGAARLSRVGARVAALALALVVLGSVTKSAASVEHYGRWYRLMAPVRAGMRAGSVPDDAFVARWIYPRPAAVRERIGVMVRYRLSLFRAP